MPQCTLTHKSTEVHNSCMLESPEELSKLRMTLENRWQIQDWWTESGPPPYFIRPGTLFLLSGSARPSINCLEVVTFIQS